MPPVIVNFQGREVTSDAGLSLIALTDENMIELPNYSHNATYFVGMKVNRSQVAYLVIQEKRSKCQVESELGNIIANMFPGHVLLR